MSKSEVVDWKLEDVVATGCSVSSDKVKKVIKLLEDGGTIPFISRYRKEYTGDITPTILYQIKEKSEECKKVIDRVAKALKSIDHAGELNDIVKTALRNCKTIEDVEFVADPYKAKGPRTLAARARSVGLENVTLMILEANAPFKIEDFISDAAHTEYNTLEKIKEAIRNIIADMFAKNVSFLAGVDRIFRDNSTILLTKLIKEKTNGNSDKAINKDNQLLREKLRNYHDFSRPVNKLYSHQIMAINRGEKNKILKITIQISDAFKNEFISLCNRKFVSKVLPTFADIFDGCAEDAYKRLVLPHLSRNIRTQLTKKAQTESLSVFESNLRQLLMAGPLRDVPILGIDPGFEQGIKMASIDNQGTLLSHCVARHLSDAKEKLRQLIIGNHIEYIAIGDGCGSQRAVDLVSAVIQENHLSTRFVVVRECGSSVWSVSAEAEAEMPEVEDKVRSAVSIARRLQDPLAEYVKMEPRCLGVGMYQHDLSPAALLGRVGAVLDDCISFVGVDINHASERLLRHVGGIGPAKAKAIVDYRKEHGPFVGRRQLLVVRGIGEAVFEQCAGFMRVKGAPPSHRDTSMIDLSNIPPAPKVRKVAKEDKYKFHPLDQTSVHPESYDVAENIIKFLNLNFVDVGTVAMQQAAQRFMADSDYRSTLSFLKTEKIGLETLEDIVLSLSRPLQFDERNHFDRGLLRQSCGHSSLLRVQQRVTGVVSNVTTFGIFVDIGVERAAFAHRPQEGLVLGDAVEGFLEHISGDRLSLCRLRKVYA